MYTFPLVQSLTRPDIAGFIIEGTQIKIYKAQCYCGAPKKNTA